MFRVNRACTIRTTLDPFSTTACHAPTTILSSTSKGRWNLPLPWPEAVIAPRLAPASAGTRQNACVGLVGGSAQDEKTRVPVFHHNVDKAY